MSQFADAVLFHVQQQVSGCTVRNAITDGFAREAEIPPDVYPHVQAFAGNLDPEDLGDVVQFRRVYSLTLWMLRPENDAEQCWSDLESIRDALNLDPRLEQAAGQRLVDMIKEGTMRVDEFSVKTRVLGRLDVLADRVA